MSNEQNDPKSNKTMGMWIAIGVTIGAGVGIALDNIALGMGIGFAIGVAIGVTSNSLSVSNSAKLIQKLEKHLHFLLFEYGFQVEYEGSSDMFDNCMVVLGSAHFNLRFVVDRSHVTCEIGTKKAPSRYINYCERDNPNFLAEIDENFDLEKAWFYLYQHPTASIIDYINQTPVGLSILDYKKSRNTKYKYTDEQLKETNNLLQDNFSTLTELFNVENFHNNCMKMNIFFENRYRQFNKSISA